MINPPVDPNQLPPRTEGFSFCHAASPSVAVSALVIQVRDHRGKKIYDSGNLPGVSPGVAFTHDIDDLPMDEGSRIICNATTSAGSFTFQSFPQPDGTHVCYAICGIRDNKNQSGVVPFGVFILDDGTSMVF
jgi:hypothetical protein